MGHRANPSVGGCIVSSTVSKAARPPRRKTCGDVYRYGRELRARWSWRYAVGGPLAPQGRRGGSGGWWRIDGRRGGRRSRRRTRQGEIREILDMLSPEEDVLASEKAVRHLKRHLDLLKTLQDELLSQIEKTNTALDSLVA